MQDPRKNKHHNASRGRLPTPSYERGVNVPSHKVIDRFVPRSPINSYTWAVPPLQDKSAVECSIASKLKARYDA